MASTEQVTVAGTPRKYRVRVVRTVLSLDYSETQQDILIDIASTLAEQCYQCIGQTAVSIVSTPRQPSLAEISLSAAINNGAL